ncbi:SDR family NAD(P)-dependent oxidoreductase [Falsiroseomonas selenitidurans]|uniref:SDR family NAD(P)-dependent oxidoreductase n=1 Tax=Falsiroseomonas selenitidurans TaxID=2716335 RepID=A0ABX1E5H2_9PROT|nr:SDR family NAD(P)-dependent oxidoreductase [Falsiroseomonas selenitidurans]NKC32238.1 SDR family NAD(P)-dependent oxidoreductase [Falsiroseomonas selenitidurans]
MRRESWQGVLITGASSGLGRALAEACAAPGVTLHLSGRDEARLAAAAAACTARGATVRPAVLDVTDAAAMAGWIGTAGRLDLVIANAGVSGGTGAATEPPEQAARIFATNLGGVLNTALPALQAMAGQAPGADGLRGRVAVVASLAAFVAAPGAPAYCASKAAVQRWAEATDASQRRHGIRLHAICPGYIRTPMTARNPFPMPWLMTPEQAATRTLAGLAAGRVRVAYPRRLYALSRIAGALPPAWRNALMGRLPAKPAEG